MPYYVYILRSVSDGTYYKGSTEDYLKRFEEHNAGLSRYTSSKIPWLLIYVELHPDKRSALIRERKLKKCKAEYFEWLKVQPTNILNMPPSHSLG
jgi:putative endonuclease